MDGIIIFNLTFEIFLEGLEKVFCFLDVARLHLKPSKCYFGYDMVKNMGHIVRVKGHSVRPRQDKSNEKIPHSDLKEDGVQLSRVSLILLVVLKNFRQLAIEPPSFRTLLSD